LKDNDMKRRLHAAGFTLIELMVTMVIVAILAAVAYPSYRSHITKTHRDAAKACMTETAQFAERWYTTNMSYATVPADPALGCTTQSNLNERYTIRVSNQAASTFTVTATPVGEQLRRDTKCGALTLNQLGVRGEGGTATDVNQCW
jgi:type IV pilus assembly protein PilE